MKKSLVVCAPICAALYVAHLVVFPTDYLRYRLTLDVDVDGVTRSGSGVVEIAYQGRRRVFPVPGLTWPSTNSQCSKRVLFSWQNQKYVVCLSLRRIQTRFAGCRERDG